MKDDASRFAIRDLNDAFRKSGGDGGRFMMSQGVALLADPARIAVVQAVREFDKFDQGAEEGNDPYGEHDFGALTLDGAKYFWKIDYYDKAVEMASDDPADPEKTTRVLTIMLAGEY